MTDMERKTFCAALSRYGAQAQITMVFEEMAELQDVLCKFLRGRVDGDTLANIAEEIADVGIMLDQVDAVPVVLQIIFWLSLSRSMQLILYAERSVICSPSSPISLQLNSIVSP